MKDESGKRYGRLKVIDYAGLDKRNSAKWNCICDCGNACIVVGNYLRNGHTTSCGCARRTKENSSPYIKDIVNHKFGRLTVLERDGKSTGGNSMVKCICECGNIIRARASNLTSGNTQSCGCLQRERSSESLTKLLIGKKGEESFNWNPNITQEERENKRNTPENKDFRDRVYERDHYTCQCCLDSTGGNLNAHHKNSWDTFKEQRYLIDNGVTLCNTCHKLFHSHYGYGNNTEEQIKEFLNNFKSEGD